VIDLRSNVVSVRHSLAAVLLFEDMFSDTAVRAPLEVSIPTLDWRAVAAGDGTHRFVHTVGEPPAGMFDVEVLAPGGEYRNFAPFQITLPHAAPTPPTRLGWLIKRPLWPTRALRLSPGETALVARLETGGVAQAGRKVRFLGSGAPVDPHTFSDERGELLAYFPFAKRDVLDSPPVVDLELTLEIDDGAATATPATVVVPMGTVLFQRIEIT
jgi:hypothetical protein